MRSEQEIRDQMAHLEKMHSRLEHDREHARIISGQYELLRWVLAEIQSAPGVL